jgi:hypothetical protein
MKVAALVDNLFFSSKIRATATGTGCEIAFCRTSGDIPGDSDRVIVDLESTSFDAVGEIREFRASNKSHPARVFAFAGHSHTDLMRKAREAGADEVMPRSELAKRLGALLRPGEAEG